MYDVIVISYFDYCLGVQCPALTSPANGRVSVPSRLVNRGASYSCLSGYSLIGTPTRTCQSSGSWSGQQPRCKLRIVQKIQISSILVGIHVQCPALFWWPVASSYSYHNSSITHSKVSMYTGVYVIIISYFAYCLGVLQCPVLVASCQSLLVP